MTRQHRFLTAILMGATVGAIPAQAEEHPLAGTTLKQLADGMEPGTFLRLQGGPNDPTLPEGFGSYGQVQMTGTFHSSADMWAPIAVWSPLTRRVYQVLDRTGGPLTYDRTAISGYDAATHSWIRHKLHPDSKEKKILGAPHVYGGWALDNRRGKLYRPVRGVMWEYDLREETWSSREIPSLGVAGQASKVFHHELDRMLTMTSKGEVRAWNPEANTVETLPGGNPAQSGRHGLSVYNAVRREVMFWSGDGGREITLVGADGVGVAKTRAADSVNEGARNSSMFLSYDPLSGNYLSFGGHVLWEYSPDRDEWRLALDLRKGQPNRFPPYHGHLMTPIPELGIIMWNHQASPRLYKHKSVFGSEE